MYIFLKLIIDKLASLITIILLMPLLTLISILILIFDGRPLLFKQVRLGKDSKPFELIKFRTMKTASNLSDNERITKVGNFLRKTSLDELPELFNILKGEMSFIGPRPLLPEYLEVYTAREILRHTVLPGLSGLSQVSGRNRLTWDKKLELDALYAEKISLTLDIKILIKTFFVIFDTSKVSESPNNTMTNLLEHRRKN